MNMPVIESKTFGVLHEVKQVGVTESEFPGAVDPKRIVPNHLLKGGSAKIRSIRVGWLHRYWLARTMPAETIVLLGLG